MNISIECFTAQVCYQTFDSQRFTSDFSFSSDNAMTSDCSWSVENKMSTSETKEAKKVDPWVIAICMCNHRQQWIQLLTFFRIEQLIHVEWF